MKKLLICLILISIVLFAFWLNYGGIPKRIDTSFATSARLKNHYGDNAIDVTVTNANDIKALKDILNGWASNPPCDTTMMFCVMDISVTLTNGQKNITFCPGFGEDTRVEIYETGKYLYLSDKQRKALGRICRKYNVIIP